ncbi:hypothetical protein EW146_g2287 [Bondarzewia mesenterica]|uniref:FAD-binding domain-containing protein n=1 Tax=Bondarzewia mesenterica TaxID=1095465 RepID=A0A4S4M120_9AGAM|nr:hypothetical protein EW146_g2287 [Bondarzewia mesenterica]
MPCFYLIQSLTACILAQEGDLREHGKASLSLNIVIVGCGIGGLAAAHCLGRAGHNITLLEQSPVIGEVGAGIQVTPNVSRLLIRWGVGDRLDKQGIRPLGFSFRRYQDGEEVGWSALGEQMTKDHGAPYYHLHRAELHGALSELALSYATFRLNSRVVSIDPSVPTLTLQTGEVITADLIIAADGVRSMIREVVVGGPDKPIPTGDAAYRAIIPTAEMAEDPELKPFLDKPQMNAWMGPNKHVMMYKIRSTECNLVLCHPDRGATESWTAEGNVDKMREEYKDFEPRVQKILALVPQTMVWRLMDREPLSKWIHKDGRVALMGDACHPMLPYRAQGAAMAIEDAAVLGVLFSHLSDYSQIHPFLSAYESIRYPRTTSTQLSSRLNQRIYHYEDGPEQEARDASMREAMLRALGKAGAEIVPSDNSGNANQWADKRKNIEQFSYDAELEAEKWWRQNGDALLSSAK